MNTVRRGLLWMALAAALALLAAACGARGAVSVGPVPDESPAGSPSPGQTGGTGEPSPGGTGSPSGRTVTFEVWFHQADRLFMTKRTEPFTQAVGRASLEALLAGPSDLETAVGVGTSIPPGTELLDLGIADGVATVDLSSDFESGGGSLTMAMRLAQVVYTLTQFDSVDAVSFRLDGQPVEVFSGEGLVLDGPVDREDYLDLFPVILVESPVIGATVSSPVTISGVANVFEANVTVRIIDQAGNELVRDFTTATCGTGCYGDYSIDLAFSVNGEQQGMIEVSDDDAAGTGTPPHIVEIPVILAP